MVGLALLARMKENKEAVELGNILQKNLGVGLGHLEVRSQRAKWAAMGLRCHECGTPIGEKAIRSEIARLMNARKSEAHRLPPEQAREFGRKGALARWHPEKLKE